MTVSTAFPYDKEYIEQFSKDKNEPDWMKSFRLDALEQASKLELPKPDKTNISRWDFTSFKHTAEGETISCLHEIPTELQDYVDAEKFPENLIIQRNQSVAYASLSEELKNQGVIFTDIFTAIRDHADLVKKYYMTDAVSVNEHKLTALHSALMNGGVFVYIPKNVQVEQPIQTIFWQEDEEVALFNHVLVVADENSSVTYIENYFSNNKETKTVSNVVAEVIAEDNAKILFGAVDNFAAGTTTYINRRGIAKDHATIDWALGQMNDGNTVSENITHLVGDHSVCHANTVTIGSGEQLQNFTTKTHHFGKDTDGQILQRGVMKDRTASIFNAIGKIEKGATRSNGVQESRILMLSEKARGDANPILLIDEDDVTAGHAASVGRVDEIQMYYLMSRGITKAQAEQLIIHGFLEPVVNQLSVEAVQNQFRHLIERKIG
ncbi:Fe-S cluster assembly protein SufD [Ornithinibacillus sp. 4-3]|uniref:Fe-S cluster assembly protein SufD n=1 Tax=Ornithinibacillus sp. 4-3 TaxID=3231488 RepID=A0AB39HP41_9BACI